MREVSVDGDEEPQTRVHGVVLRCLTAVREAIGQHTLTHEASERAQYAERDFRAARGKCQTRQGNHGVAPPIAEPGVARNDGLAERCTVDIAAFHQELVGGERQLLDSEIGLRRGNPRRGGEVCRDFNLPRSLGGQRRVCRRGSLRFGRQYH